MNIARMIFSSFVAVLDFITKYFKTVVFLFIVFLIIQSNKENVEIIKDYDFAEVKLEGPIMDSKKVLDELKEAQKSKNLKGILLVVDSPGGAIEPSVEIAYTLKKLKEKIKIVAYSKGTIASGSYYASIYSDKIVSNPGSIVGSIGVIMQGVDISGLMSKIGVKAQTAKAGLYKEAGTMSREWTKTEREAIQEVIDSHYKTFVDDVALARGLDINKSDKFANGRFFTAKMAKGLGLIDSIGIKEDAKLELEKIVNIKDGTWKVEEEPDPIDKYIEKFAKTSIEILFQNLYKIQL